MSNPLDNLFRRLPSVAKLLDDPAMSAVRLSAPLSVVTDAIRAELDHQRRLLAYGEQHESFDQLSALVPSILARIAKASELQLREVINATGLVLHTNLGRSPMSDRAATAAYDAARRYLNLELSLDTGKRSSRQDPIRNGLCKLTGAEAATAVNNCAAATVIVLRAMAAGKEVIVSRGQLIEIGGSFRIPDIMQVSGAILKEVGTTNITRMSDYENAIGPNTAMLLRVHSSNFCIRGFTESVSIEELVQLGRKYGIPVVDDAGSGAVYNLDEYGLSGEPLVADGIKAGADVVLFSGDKLLGGPQSGLIAGKQVWIDRIERDPLMRAFRLDKMVLAALEATLDEYTDFSSARTNIPTLQILTTSLEELRTRCAKLAEPLRESGLFESVIVRDDVGYAGGGTLPDVAVPTCVIELTTSLISEEEFATRLRCHRPAVLGRRQAGHYLLDLRAVFEDQVASLVVALCAAAQS
jgi:L-seryl-tRNA(Ser) seleniumtransferase